MKKTENHKRRSHKKFAKKLRGLFVEEIIVECIKLEEILKGDVLCLE